MGVTTTLTGTMDMTETTQDTEAAVTREPRVTGDIREDTAATVMEATGATLAMEDSTPTMAIATLTIRVLIT